MDENKIVFHRIGFYFTLRCTLRCKLCCGFSPYYPEPVPHPSYEELTGWIEHFFELVDSVDIFTCTGGEPLLNNRAADVIDFIGRYRDRIGRLEIITNGTIVPKRQVIDVLKRTNCRVLLDDYGPDISTKAEEIERVLNENEVSCERRYNGNTEKGAHCGGWVDILHLSDEPVSFQEAKDLFDSCLQVGELRCNPVINGKINVCPVYDYWVKQGKFENLPQLSFDLSDRSLPIDERKRKIVEFLELSDVDYLPTCAYCGGYLKTSKRYVPAEQLK